MNKKDKAKIYPVLLDANMQNRHNAREALDAMIEQAPCKVLIIGLDENGQILEMVQNGTTAEAVFMASYACQALLEQSDGSSK